MNKKEVKRLIVVIEDHLHKHIKVICAEKRISMGKWVIEALIDKLKKEKELGF